MSSRPCTLRLGRLGLVAALALGLAGCLGPSWQRQTVYQDSDVEVVLRSEKGAPPAYDHPVTISAVRTAHILASLDVRLDDQEEKNARTPAVPLDLVFPLGELVADALAQADATQHVLVMARRTERNLKIFTEKRLTSFVVYMQNDRLYVHLGHVDWEVPRNPNERIYEPAPGKALMKFRVLGGRGILPVGPQAVAVDWRDDTFRRASSVRLRPGGRVQRRTILMEEPVEEAPAPRVEDTVDFSELSPETLRELADLEEARRSGEVSEAEYRARREDLLQPTP